MKGLFLKDIINLKQQVKIYLLIMAIWMAIGFANQDGAFFGGVMTVFTVMIPISALAYDEKAKWERYALTMPVSKTDLILSKYLLALCCSVSGTLVSLIVSIIISNDAVNSFIASMILMCVGLIFVSIVLPIMFKFGVEKGRMLMFIVVFLPTILTIFLPRLNIPMPSDDMLDKLLYFLPVITIVIIAASVFISKVIYEHKEF